MINSPDMYIHPSVNPEALSLLVSDCRNKDIELRAVEIYENNSLMLRFSPAPYSCSDKAEVYSMSKSFAATAVGIAIDEGLVTLETKLSDIFPDKLPEHMCEYMSSLTVYNILTMNTGHEYCTMDELFRSEDPVRTFFQTQLKYKPGTHFTYNTGASFMLSAIINRVTGRTMRDYICEKCLYEMGIYDTKWNGWQGINLGGVGIAVSADDIAKFGLLYLNGGVYNGKRLLPRKWTESVGQPHSNTGSECNPDYQNGYGFQFWANREDIGGYRADGAYGQFCLILPERSMVVVFRSEGGDNQAALNLIYSMLEKLHDESIVPGTPLVTEYTFPHDAEKTLPYEGYYICSDNPMGFKTLNISKCGKEAVLRFSDGMHETALKAGFDSWSLSEFTASYMRPILWAGSYRQSPELYRIASGCEADSDSITIHMRHLTTPNTVDIHISGEAASPVIKFSSRWGDGLFAEGAGEIKLKRI